MCIIWMHKWYKAHFYANRVINTENSNSLNCQNQYAYKLKKTLAYCLEQLRKH